MTYKRSSSLFAAVAVAFLFLGSVHAGERSPRVSRAAVREYLQASYPGKVEGFTFEQKEEAVVIQARLKGGRVKTILVSPSQLAE